MSSRLRYLAKLPKVLAFILGALALLAGVDTVVFGDSFLYTSFIEAGKGVLRNDYFLVSAIAGVGILLALVFAFQGRAGTIQQTETPNAEGAQAVPAPGDDFDEFVQNAQGWRAREDREAVRERLHKTAVDAVTKAENCPRYSAEHRVETGAWTTDAYAASLLGEEGSPNLPLLTRLRSYFGGSSFEISVARTVEEIEGLLEEQDG